MHMWFVALGLALWLAPSRAGAAPSATNAELDAGAPIATAIELSVTPERPRYGEQVQVRARVVSATGSEVPTGSVRFTVNEPTGPAETLARLDAAGYASLTFAPTSTKVKEIAASYDGDARHTGSTWKVPIYIDSVPSQTTLASSANPTKAGNLRLTVTVAAVAPVAAVASAPSPPRAPSGKVHFLSGTQEIAVLALDSNGQAVFDASSIRWGTHTFSVRYDGDENYFESATLEPLQQRIDPYATTVSVEASTPSSVYGEPVTFSITVTGADGGAPAAPMTLRFTDSNYTYYDGSSREFTSNTPGKATYTTSRTEMRAGTHSISIQFHRDGKYDGAYATTTVVVKKAPTKTSLTLEENRLKAKVTADMKPHTFDGRVAFFDRGSRIGHGDIEKYNSEPSIWVGGLDPGEHPIVATYDGNRDLDRSHSEPFTIKVPPRKPNNPDPGAYDAGIPRDPPPRRDAGSFPPPYDPYDATTGSSQSGCSLSEHPVSQGGALFGALGLALTFVRRRYARAK